MGWLRFTVCTNPLNSEQDSDESKLHNSCFDFSDSEVWAVIFFLKSHDPHPGDMGPAQGT